MALVADHCLIGTVGRNIDDFKNIAVVSCCNRRCALNFSKVVDTKIVRNPDGPWQELTLFIIVISAKCFDDLDEYVLEQVFCKVAVLYKDMDRSKDLVFVTAY